MPEMTARRYKKVLTAMCLAIVIAIPVGLLAQGGRGGGQRGGGGAVAVPAGQGAPPAGAAAAQPAQGRGGAGAPGAAGSAKAAAPVDLTGTWVSLVTEDWIERMSPDSPPSGTRGGGGRGGGGRGGGGGGAPAAVPAGPTDPCRVYAAGGSLRVPGRLNISWADDNTLKIDMDAGTQTRLLHFNASVPPGAPKTLQGYSVATWDTGARGGGGFGGGGGNRGGGAQAPRWGNLHVVTTNMTGGYLLSSRNTYSDNATLTENFTRHSDFGIEYFTVIAVIDENGQNRSTTSSTFKKEPDASKFAPTGCEVVK